jgi:hypothetical protein
LTTLNDRETPASVWPTGQSGALGFSSPLSSEMGMRYSTVTTLLTSSSILVMSAAAFAQTAPAPIALNSTVDGTLSASDSVHPERSTYYQEFTFQGTQGMVVEIIVGSEAIDTYAFLVGPSGEEIAYNDDGAGNLDSRIQMTLPTTGQYRIQATTFSQSTTGPFTVSLAEYIQLPVQTRTLALGSEVSVQLTAQDGQCGDYGRRCQVLEFDLDAGQFVSVSQSDSGGGVTLRALDPYLGTIWEAAGYSGEIGNQTILASTPGTYTLVAMGSPGSRSTVSVQGAEAAASVSVAAQSITEGTINGALAQGDAPAAYNSGVMDLYTVEVDAGQRVQVSLNSNDFDAYLRVLDGTTVVAQNDDTEGLNSRVRYRDSGSGEVVVEVSSLGGSFGSYELIVEAVDSAPSAPASISSGEVVQGELLASDSTQVSGAVQDAYVFEGTEGERVSIVVQSGYGVSMRVVSPMGEILSDGGDYGVYAQPMYYDDGDHGLYGGEMSNGSAGYNGILPATGTYIINLSSFDAGSALSYRLSLRDGLAEVTPLTIGSSTTDSLDQTDSWVQSVGRVGDVYSFSVDTPMALELGLSCNQSAYATLVNSTDMQVLEVSSDEGANARQSIFLAPGDYTAVVSSHDPAGTAYTISVQETTITPPQIESLAPGQTITGSLSASSPRNPDGAAVNYFDIPDASGQVAIGLVASSYNVGFVVLNQIGETVGYGSPTISENLDDRSAPVTFDAVEGQRYMLVVSAYLAGGAQYRAYRY